MRQKNIKMVKQPKGSTICGQCCISMITGKPIKRVIAVFGHSHSTRTIELYKALKYLGVSSDKKLTRWSSINPIPAFGVLKITYTKTHSHWVVIQNGVCYCPSGKIHHWPKYLTYTNMGRITSFLPINN